MTVPSGLLGKIPKLVPVFVAKGGTEIDTQAAILVPKPSGF
jgi:hypothetical protein